LENASFEIPAGSFCVILGPSGAGKSSIANLLVRLYDPESGSICVNGIDIRTVSLKQLRQRIALVEQDTFLFNGSIADNVRYGGDRDVPQILSLNPETVVGDRGLALSGGEKQAIGITRALARNPEILILDEATSAMDAELEKKVLGEVRRVMHGRTIIFITHRVYLAEQADVVLQLKDGHVTVVACSTAMHP
jgi:ABC-type multidrug transport system fused ATPase/permease subunit